MTWSGWKRKSNYGYFLICGKDGERWRNDNTRRVLSPCPSRMCHNWMTDLTIAEGLQQQLSGYGVKLPLVMKTLSDFPFLTDRPLRDWKQEELRQFVTVFVEVMICVVNLLPYLTSQKRFPTVLALNKIDLHSSEKHIVNLCEKVLHPSYILPFIHSPWPIVIFAYHPFSTA